jgi:hypothetical protein
VGLDQHQDTIMVATAVSGRGEPALFGQIASSVTAVTDLAHRNP